MVCRFNKLSEIADVIDSLHKTPEYSVIGKPMVRCTDVRYGRLDLSKTFKVDEIVFKEFTRRYTPRVDDIVITRVGSYGITAFVDDTNFCLGQNTAAIISKINPRYLYLTLNSQYVKNQIESSVVGSTQKTLSLKAINDLNIPRFDPVEEKIIAHILGTLDDKIECNRRMNETLEEMARAMFQSWFVDFDPVIDNALAAGNEIPEELQERAARRQALGNKRKPLPKDIQKLFPAKFELTQELGWIPVGWEEKALNEICKFGGDRVSISELTIENYISTENMLPNKAGVVPAANLPQVSQTTKYNAGNVLVSNIRPYFKKIFYCENQGGCSADVLCFVAKGNMSVFLYNLLYSDKFFEYVMTGAKGTKMPRGDKQQIMNYPVAKPSDNIISKFTEFNEQILKQIADNKKQTKVLAQIRDTLLPKLISGELRIEDAERFVECNI